MGLPWEAPTLYKRNGVFKLNCTDSVTCSRIWRCESVLWARGWHGSGFSNLSRPTPTKKNLVPSQSHKKTGGKSRPVPIPEEWLPFPPTPVFFFFGRNLSVTLKIQYRSQRAHLSWITIHNVVFCYYIELKASLNNAQCALHTHSILCKSSMLTHTFSRLFDFFNLKVDISLSINIFFIDGVSKFLAQVHRDRLQKRILFALITLQ